MNQIEIPAIGKSFNFPEHLGECDPRQYAMVCRLFYQYQSAEIDFDQFKVAAVYQLLNMKPNETDLPEKEQDRVNANIYQLTELFESFFIEKEKGKYLIRQEYAHNPIPKITWAKGNLYGPTDYMRSTVFGEYVDALNIFGMYTEHPDPALLYDLAAILYRRKGKKYNSDDVEWIAKKLKYTDFGYVYGVYMFLASFQHYLTNAKINWEGKELDLSILFKKANDGFVSQLPGVGMKSTAYMLAENGILGNLEQVNQTPTWEVLLLMYDIKKGDLDNTQREKQAKTH